MCFLSSVIHLLVHDLPDSCDVWVIKLAATSDEAHLLVLHVLPYKRLEVRKRTLYLRAARVALRYSEILRVQLVGVYTERFSRDTCHLSQNFACNTWRAAINHVPKRADIRVCLSHLDSICKRLTAADSSSLISAPGSKARLFWVVLSGTLGS